MRRIAYLLVYVLLILETVGGEEILMSTQWSLSFQDNLTLSVMDVNLPSEVVWLRLSDENETLKSGILGVGESFVYDGMNLTVTGIYAGGERDLVAVDVVSGTVINRSLQESSGKIPESTGPGKKIPGFGWDAVLLLALALASRSFIYQFLSK